MLKIFLFLIFSFFSLSLSHAQLFKNSQDRSNFRLNLWPLFAGRLSGLYEYQMKQVSFNLNGNIAFAGTRQGYLIGSNFRYYFSDKRTTFFMGGVANFSNYYENAVFQLNGAEESTTVRGESLLLALNGGVRISILRIFNITGRLGYAPPIVLGYYSTSEKMPVNDLDVYRKEFVNYSSFDGEISFGLRF
jgi:hypothetical protein